MSGKCSHKQYKLVLIQAIQVNTPPTWFMCINASYGEGPQPSLWSVLSTGGWFFPVTNAPRRRSAGENVCRLSKHADCRVRHQRGGAEGSQASLWSIGGRFSVAAAGRMDPPVSIISLPPPP